jgi:Bacterial PH domain
MPAASEPPAAGSGQPGEPVLPSLPRTMRPFGVRIAIYVAAVLLVVVVVVTWFAFPPEIRDAFSWSQRITVLLLGGMFYVAGFGLARSRVVARRDGLTVVNGYRTRRFEWAEVLAVTLRPGSPWAVLDITDGSTVAAMGIQGSDGPRAQRQVRELRALAERLSR